MSSSGFVSRYTPSMMPPEALEAIFVQRETLAQRLVEKMMLSAKTAARHHALLVGPRGIGKTHLVSLVHHRLQQAGLPPQAKLAWLREEEYAIASYTDLILEVIRSLAEPAAFREVLASLGKESPGRQADLAEEALLRFIGSGVLIVITENLDQTFHAIGTEGQEKLRAFIQNHPVISLLATAQSLFGGVSLRTSPFYGFFEIHHLERLTFDEAVEMLVKIAAHKGDQELVAALHTPEGRARVRAVHHLAEGNPRIYVILSQFIEAKSLDQLVDPVLKVLDDLTPFYQSQMSLVSPHQRKILEYLCSQEGAKTVQDIASANLLTPQSASSQLKKLRDLGYVRPYELGRNSYYELSEPLMRIALAVKRHRGEPIRLFIDFLRCWYSKPELEQLLELRGLDGIDGTYLTEALKTMGTDDADPKIAACERDFKRDQEAGDSRGALKAAEELVVLRGSAPDFFFLAKSEFALRNFAESAMALEKAMALGLSASEKLKAAMLGFMALGFLELGRDDEALKALLKAKPIFKATTTPELFEIFDCIVPIALIKLHRIDEAVKTVRTLCHSSLPIDISLWAVEMIPLLVKPEYIRAWAELWADIWAEDPEGHIPLQLLQTAADYLESHDKAVLLSLPSEQRSVLLPLLKLTDADLSK